MLAGPPRIYLFRLDSKLAGWRISELRKLTQNVEVVEIVMVFSKHCVLQCFLHLWSQTNKFSIVFTMVSLILMPKSGYDDCQSSGEPMVLDKQLQLVQ